VKTRTLTGISVELCPNGNRFWRPDPAFNYLVGDGQQHRRHGEAKRLGGRQIDDEIESGWLLDRDVAWLRYIALGPPCLQRATAARLQAPIPLSNLHFSRANCRQVPMSIFWPAVAFCARADSVGAATRIIVANALKKMNVRMISSVTIAVTGEQGNSQRPQRPGAVTRLVVFFPSGCFDLMNPSWEFSFDHLVGMLQKRLRDGETKLFRGLPRLTCPDGQAPWRACALGKGPHVP
jgi:hypothetical protein